MNSEQLTVHSQQCLPKNLNPENKNAFRILKSQILKIKIPKIYPITDVQRSGISHAEQVQRLISGGANFIQLREKYAAPGDFYESAKDALETARAEGARIIINDRADICLALKADGIHLGQDDLPPAEARKILGTKAIIGFSTHSVEQAIKAVKLPLDYIAIGPVFPTRTKENPDQVVGLDGVRKVREAIGNFPLVAIGSINSGNFCEVLRAGADSVAIVSDIISDADNITANIEKLFAAQEKC